MLSLLWHEIYSRRLDILGCGLGLTAFAAIYLGIYPSMADQMALFDLSAVPFYEAMGVTDMASFEGYAAGTFVNFLPILLAIYAITTGTGMLAGEEDEGTLEILVTLPLPRWQIVLAKGLALGIALLLVLLITAVGVISIFLYIQNDITTTIQTTDWLPIVFAAWPLTFAFGMASLFFGTIAPNRRKAGMLATLFFLVNYVGHTVAGMSATYRNWQKFFLFDYYDNSRLVFSEGIAVTDLLLVTIFALLCLALTIVAFQRRNLMVGAWIWR